MTVWTFAMWSLLAWSGPWEAHGDVGPFPTRESCQVARETVYALQDPYQDKLFLGPCRLADVRGARRHRLGRWVSGGEEGRAGAAQAGPRSGGSARTRPPPPPLRRGARAGAAGHSDDLHPHSRAAGP